MIICFYVLFQLLDSSVLTFEVSCGDVVLKNNGFLEKAAVTKVEVHVLKVALYVLSEIFYMNSRYALFSEI